MSAAPEDGLVATFGSTADEMVRTQNTTRAARSTVRRISFLRMKAIVASFTFGTSTREVVDPRKAKPSRGCFRQPSRSTPGHACQECLLHVQRKPSQFLTRAADFRNNGRGKHAGGMTATVFII